jgi:RNA polymerase sigma-70 factor (ECF subfamily)
VTVSDSYLLERSTSDPTSFDALFLEHYDQVYGVLVRLTGNREEAEDLAQETFLRLHRSRFPAGQQHNLGGWLYRVATRLGYNALRARRRRLQYEQAHAQAVLSEQAGDADDLAELAALSEERRRVRLTLAELPARQAHLLLLRQLGLSYKELAATLDVAPSSVGTLLARAEQAFEERYKALTPG